MRKLLPIIMALSLGAATLAGCSASSTAPSGSAAASTESVQSSSSDQSGASSQASPESQSASETKQIGDTASADTIRVGSLKGPTSMGLVSLMNSDSSANHYDFTMVTAADELVSSIASGKTDIALVPANVASVLYNKTKGGVSVIDINTLGVLDVVTADPSIQSIADLKGKTVYLTGKGTTPDYVLRYLLSANGLSESDVTLEYKSEPTEVAAVLKDQPNAIGLLPQPFVTVALAQNDSLKLALDLTKEWDKVQGTDGSRLVTGVTIVRNDFLKNHGDEVKAFMSDHKESAKEALADPEKTAEQIVQAGIIAKAPIAKKALPYCNITYIDGQEMKTALSGYLNVLYKQDPKSVGGTLPADDFYYMAN